MQQKTPTTTTNTTTSIPIEQFFITTPNSSSPTPPTITNANASMAATNNPQASTLDTPESSSLSRTGERDIRHEIGLLVSSHPEIYTLIPQCIQSGCFYHVVGDVIRLRLWNRSPHTMKLLLFYVSPNHMVCQIPLFERRGFVRVNETTATAATAQEEKFEISNLPSSPYIVREYKTSVSYSDFVSLEKDEGKTVFIHTGELPGTDVEGKSKVILVSTASDPEQVKLLDRIAALGYRSYANQRVVKGDTLVYVENFVFFSSLDDYLARS